jgi:S1-C subfamily serine protease
VCRLRECLKCACFVSSAADACCCFGRQGGNSLLTVQIDAAINPGNSGGPAFSDIQVRFG